MSMVSTALNPHKLHIFAQVVQSKSFSQAAERLLMTQSAVSQHIRDLEIALGTKLFNRGSRGVTLTPAGETLHTYTRQIFQLLAEAENAVTNVANLVSGEIAVGATPGVSTYLLPDWIPAFRTSYSNLMVTVHTGTSAEILDLLQEEQVDVGIIEGELPLKPPPWLGIKLLDEIEQKIVVGANHPWWDRQKIALHELNEQSIIMRQPGSQTRIWLDQTLIAHEVTPVISAVFDNVESIKRAVARGGCLTILPPYAVQEDLKEGRLRTLSIADYPLQRTLKLLWNEERTLSSTVRVFLHHLETYLPGMGDVASK